MAGERVVDVWWGRLWGAQRGNDEEQESDVISRTKEGGEDKRRPSNKAGKWELGRLD